MIATESETPPNATVAALLAAASRKRSIVGSSQNRIQVADVREQHQRIERDQVTKSFVIQHQCSPKAARLNTLTPRWIVRTEIVADLDQAFTLCSELASNPATGVARGLVDTAGCDGTVWRVHFDHD